MSHKRKLYVQRRHINTSIISHKANCHESGTICPDGIPLCGRWRLKNFILRYRIWRSIPNILAASDWFPNVVRRTSWIYFFSNSSRLVRDLLLFWSFLSKGYVRGTRFSGRLSGRMIGPSVSIEALSRIFSNSLTLPGQEYSRLMFHSSLP